MSISINAPVPMGVANKLPIGCTQTQDETPYLFRKSGGNNNANVGNRLLLNKIIGGTVAWNQLQRFDAGTSQSNGVTYTKNSDGTVTCSGTSTGNSYLNIGSTLTGLLNHVLYICGCPKGGSTSTYYFRDGYNGIASDRDIGNGKIVKGRSNYIGQITIWSGVDATGLVFKPQMFDLTAMFGSTIADYIYSLEQANAYAGVAWLKSYGFFTADDYQYNAGSLQSVKVSAHKTVLKNLVDVADYSVSMTGYYKDKELNFVPQVGVTYTLSAAVSCDVSPFSISVGVGDDLAYRADISTVANFQNGRVSITFTPTDANLKTYKKLWMRIPRFGSSKTFTVSVFDIQLEFGSNATMYNAYSEHSYALDDIELRGISKLDSNNNLRFDGDRYLPDGTVIRKRRQIVADGDTVKVTEVNQSNGTYWCRLTTLSSANKGVNSTTTETRIITDKGYRDYPGVSAGNIYITNNGISPIICLFDQTLTTVSAVNTYLASNPITIEYELATPTTESADPYEKMQIVSKDGTEQFVDAGERDIEIPVQHETVYPIPTFAEETFGAFPMSVEESGTTQYPMEVTSQNIVVG